jgi:hypothetical protein
MRLLLSVLLVATALGLAACGDDESSQSKGEDRPAPVGTGPSAGSTGQSSPGGGDQGSSSEGSGGSTSPGQSARERRRKRRAAERERLRSRRPTRRGDFTGTNRTVYYEARSRCLTIPLRSLARAYGARSDQPDDVAQAYAEREAPIGSGHEAALAGCLDGINSRARRGP